MTAEQFDKKGGTDQGPYPEPTEYLEQKNPLDAPLTPEQIMEEVNKAREPLTELDWQDRRYYWEGLTRKALQQRPPMSRDEKMFFQIEMMKQIRELDQIIAEEEKRKKERQGGTDESRK